MKQHSYPTNPSWSSRKKTGGIKGKRLSLAFTIKFLWKWEANIFLMSPCRYHLRHKHIPNSPKAGCGSLFVSGRPLDESVTLLIHFELIWLKFTPKRLDQRKSFVPLFVETSTDKKKNNSNHGETCMSFQALHDLSSSGQSRYSHNRHGEGPVSQQLFISVRTHLYQEMVPKLSPMVGQYLRFLS